MPRKKKYPNYDPKKIMENLIEAVSELYESSLSLRKIGEELDLDQQKVRKLLCTANYRGMIEYKSEVCDEVLYYYKQKKSVAEIMKITDLSRASVQSYLPYIKVPYKESEVSANAERLRVFRAREKAVKELQNQPETFWEVIVLFQGYLFYTADGMKYKYTVHDNEMYIDREQKAIKKSTLERIYMKVLKGDVRDLKTSGVKGTYLYPLFIRLKIVQE